MSLVSIAVHGLRENLSIGGISYYQPVTLNNVVRIFRVYERVYRQNRRTFESQKVLYRTVQQ